MARHRFFFIYFVLFEKQRLRLIIISFPYLMYFVACIRDNTILEVSIKRISFSLYVVLFYTSPVSFVYVALRLNCLGGNKQV